LFAPKIQGRNFFSEEKKQKTFIFGACGKRESMNSIFGVAEK
jgi:hypothetical protein